MANVDVDKLKQLLLAMIDTLDENSEETEEKPKATTKQQPKSRKTKRKPYSDNVNLFLDMPERNMHKKDAEIDKLLASNYRVDRNRPSTMVDVRCRVCGVEETVSSSLITDGKNRYKCNNCSRSSG